ncbi:hypothetical protein [Subtercola boreus]|uniref:Uncharacterized protein n=1 Tax=Subtercola boreus TaxID=120213 RepID=A0A3E0W9U0_9MICO|nr:hypothetical protein [Subtercola boreus]RFA19269.1 hypothetical protein B7R24_11455 [Subtercola boreus]RFA19529.1 hypothetical protein B7R23_11435 [Subtercola boreus]RFA25895.1 hypothetical protein B7R25_11555 [Subtercola boreus]
MDEQGRSPRYQLGISPDPLPVSDRTAVLAWCALALLVAAYATVMTVHLALPGFSLPFVSLLCIPWALVVDRLRLRARSRPHPPMALKVLSILLVAAAVVWFFVLQFDEGLRTTRPLALAGCAALSFAIAMGAVVFAYRARFFFWWRVAGRSDHRRDR